MISYSFYQKNNNSIITRVETATEQPSARRNVPQLHTYLDDNHDILSFSFKSAQYKYGMYIKVDVLPN
jgi:hypothetical protein